jgi:hypothetical protein
MKKAILIQRYEIRGRTITTLVEVIAQQERELAVKDRELNEAAEIMAGLQDINSRL